MKMKEKFRWPYGLRSQFTISFLVSGILCACLYFILASGMECFLTYYFEHSDFGRKQIERQAESLQNYIREHDIGKENLSELAKWEKNQPLLFLELYEQTKCIYSSAEFENRETVYYDLGSDMDILQDNVVSISLNGEKITAFLYSDFTYRYYLWGQVCAFICSLVVFVCIFILSISRLIQYICRLEADIQILEGGNLEYEVTERGNDELTSLAKNMNRMRLSFQEQMESEQKLHLSHQNLITEMAHDLRTPLTSIMLYTEILRSHKYETEHELDNYLEKIDLKAHHMKAMSDHLFEYNLGESKREKTEVLDFEKGFTARLVQMASDLQHRGFRTESSLQWKPVYIQAKQEFLERIFDNISSNIIKYAQKDASVRIETVYSGKYAGFVFTNTIAATPNTLQSTSVGIQSIQTMMKQLEGICNVESTESVFEITVLFLKV